MVSNESNLTGRLDAPEAVAAENARLRLALAASGTATWMWDLATRELRWSANIAALYERDLGNIAVTFDRYLDECVHPDDRARLAAAFDLARDEGAEFRIEFCAVLPGG